MTGGDLLPFVGDAAGRRLVDALGGDGRPGYVLRLDNKNAFTRVDVEFGLSDAERSEWSALSSRLAKALGRALASAPPCRLRVRLEGGSVAWVKSVEEGTRTAFGRKSLGEPQLDAILKTVDALHRIESVLTEPGRLGFRFARPVPWPLFAILEVARPFQPHAAEWARRAATHEVRSFGLGAGAMDVDLA